MWEMHQVIESVIGFFGRATLIGVIVAAYGCGEQRKIGFQLEDTDAPSAMFTPDSKYVVAGGYRRISLLDVEARKLIDRFPEEKRGPYGTRAIQVLAISPDGRYVASAPGWRPEMPVRIWDLHNGRLIRSFDTGRTEVRAMAFSPDGTRLAAGTSLRSHDGPKPYEGVYEIWLWDLDQKGDEPLRCCGHEAPVQSIAFLPDGKRIISMSAVRIMRIWDVATRRELTRTGTWTPPPLLKPFAPGARFGGLDEGASAWFGGSESVCPLAVSRDGKHVVCGRSVWRADNLKLEYFADGLRLWKDFDDWQRIHLSEPVAAEDRQAQLLAWFAYAYVGALTPDNRRLVVAGLFGLHGAFDERLLTAKGKELLAMKTPSGKQLLTGMESQFSVFDVTTGDLVFNDQVFSNGASVFALDVSPDGRYALAAGSGVTSGPGGAPVMRDPCQLYVYRLLWQSSDP